MDNIDEIRNEFEQQLINEGYKPYMDYLHNSLRFFQKRIIDKKGTKYFLNIYHFNMKESYHHFSNLPGDTYEITSTFHYDKDTSVNVHYSATFTSNQWNAPIIPLKEAEAYFEKLFKMTKAKYYELEEY